MKKINPKILSIPPYISTSWNNINTLHMKEVDGKSILVVVLQNGTMIEVPNLELSVIEQIFTSHGKFLEQESLGQIEPIKQFEPSKTSDLSFSFGVPFRFDAPEGGLDHFGNILQHNPEQANAPDLPEEILKKIGIISKSLGMNMETMNIPKAEPHCNCVYCQLFRAIQNENECLPEIEEDIVTDEDLKFRDWDIQQENDRLYIVSNPEDKNEHYQVFLGDPIGCTCGQENCEHLRTVLNN